MATCRVKMVLPVVLDDRLGERARAAGRGLRHPVAVAPRARAMLRQRIVEDAFRFGDLLRFTGVPLAKKDEDGGWMRLRPSDRIALSWAMEGVGQSRCFGTSRAMHRASI